MSTVNNEKTIWSFLKRKGLNDYAVAGLMGNLKAESALNPQNLQGSYEKKLGFTDASYTSAVDAGSYGNFVTDKAGYGLAQWTYWSRKQNLLNFAKSKGASIGNLDMQLEFLWKELQGYKSVMATLKNAASILEASNAVLKGYERPANQGESAQKKRAVYGQDFYDKYADTHGTKETPAEPAISADVSLKTHTVQRGDTLWRLAKKYLGSGFKWTRIAKLNGVKGTLIRTGQVLKIPEKVRKGDRT